MKLEVLHVSDCPNTSALIDRLDRAVAGRADVAIEQQVIRDEVEAAACGMTGSPTLLIDGVDPFAVAGRRPSLSCRLYVDETGTMSGAPSLGQLRFALARASFRRRVNGNPTVRCRPTEVAHSDRLAGAADGHVR